jgi:serine protease Do
MAEAGQFDLALQIAQKIEVAWHRSSALAEVAAAMAKAGQTERADQAFRLALKIAYEDASDRSWALRDIAEAMAKAGQFDRALQIAQKIGDALVRSLALRKIAEAMAEAGQTERANQAFQLALQTTQEIHRWFRPLPLKEIAEALAKAGQIDRAVDVAEMIDKPVVRLQALAAIMVAKQKAGKGEAGKE